MRILLSIFLLLALNYCNFEKVSISGGDRKERENRKIVAEIGDMKVFYREWKRYLSDAGIKEDGEGEILTKLFRRFLERELVYKAAIDSGIRPDGERYKIFLKRLGLLSTKASQEEFVVTEFLEKNVKEKVFVSKEEIKKYYKENMSHFRQKKLYHIKEIVVKNKELAEEIHSELVKNGVLRFGNFAREYSISPSATNGGDIGYFSRNQLPPEFEKIVFSLKPGEISDVIRTKYGYHIFYLEEVIGEHQLKLYEVKDKIESLLRGEKEKSLYSKLLLELRKKYMIKIHYKNLGFRFSGE